LDPLGDRRGCLSGPGDGGGIAWRIASAPILALALAATEVGTALAMFRSRAFYLKLSLNRPPSAHSLCDGGCGSGRVPLWLAVFVQRLSGDGNGIADYVVAMLFH
jgi:hypothetical protein